MWNDTLLDSVVNIALAAGQEILAVYNQAGDIAVSTKADDSPLTEADRRAHTLIMERLITLDDQIPVSVRLDVGDKRPRGRNAPCEGNERTTAHEKAKSERH